jgi:hypothetical protein
MDLDPAKDKADHTLAVPVAITDPVYQSSPESDSEGGEVYMVGNGEEPLEKIVKEIQRKVEEEITRAARLARELKRGKRHNDLQDDSSASEDEPRDSAPMRRHHLKLNSWRLADRDRLRNRSRSI